MDLLKRRLSMDQPFQFRGYDIPVGLVGKTGGGPDSFEKISDWHIAQVQRYIGIQNTDHVLEVGCGIGRDAIPLTELLTKGKYIGTDAIAPSIQWCTDNITKKHPNFFFVHHDIYDTLHNPKGKLNALDIKLPAEDESIDLILLQSVFTHMFTDEIVHYFQEFNRILKQKGRIWATLFIVNPELLKAISTNKQSDGPHTGWNLSFKLQKDTGCFINKETEPRQSVAYEESILWQMIEKGGLSLAQPVLWGNWSGTRDDPKSGQDAIILKKSV